MNKITKSEQTTSVVKSKNKSKWRWLYYIAGLFAVLLISLTLVLSTGYGQRSIIQLVDKYLDELSIGSVSGNLQEGLKLKNAHFSMQGVNAKLEETQLKIKIGCLLERKLCVENITVKNPLIDIDTSQLTTQQQPSKKEKKPFELPLVISANQLAVENLLLNIDGTAISLKHLSSGIHGEGKNLQLAPTDLDHLDIILPQAVTSEQKNANSSNNVTAQSNKIDWNAIKDRLNQPLLTSPEDLALPFNLALPRFNVQNIVIKQKVKKDNQVTTEPLLTISSLLIEKGELKDQKMQLAKLVILSDKGNISGSAMLNLVNNLPINGKFNAQLPLLKKLKIPKSNAELKLSGELLGLTQLELTTQGVANAHLIGNLKLAEAKTPFRVTLTSDKVHYPFIPEKNQKVLTLKDIALSLSGDLLNYQLNAKMNASGMDLPKSQLDVIGNGELTSFNVEKLKLDALNGTALLSGNIDWQEGLKWQSNAHLTHIKTHSLLPQWAATLSGNLTSTGYVGKGEKGELWSVDISQLDLKGKLFNQTLLLKGELTANNKTLLDIKNTKLIYGKNHISMHGILGKTSQFNADITAPNLKGLIPHLSASINGKVNLTGDIIKPNLDMDLIANNVHYQDLNLQHLTAKGTISTDKQIKGDVKINLSQLAYGDIKVQKADLTVTGDEKNHHLTLHSSGEPFAANLQISGTFNRLLEKWSGQLSKATLQSPIGEWKNDKNIQISYNNKKIEADISAHCWKNTNASACFPTSFRAGKTGKVPFEIQQLDLSFLKQFLDKKTQLDGLVNLKGDAQWFENKAPQLDLEANANTIQLKQKIDYRTFPLTLEPVKLTVKLINNTLNVNSLVKIKNNGQLVSQLTVSDIVHKRALSGHINIENINMKLLKPLIAKSEKIDGNINANLHLGGTALAPLLNGDLNLTQLKAQAYTMPFDITDGALNIKFNGTNSTLTGHIQAPNGELTLTGDANWQDLNNWHTHIQTKGNNFRLKIPNIAKLDISPDIEVTATPNKLILGGNIDIPWADIEIEELPENTVNVSSDEVIMDGSAKKKGDFLKKLAKTNKNKSMVIQADVNIRLIEDKINLSAYGLKTQLYGLVKVSQGSKGLGLYGQIHLKKGTYNSFGQNLIIRKGNIIFSGIPSQPTLNIKAIRNPEAIENTNITAGVHITGVADSPKVSIFSEPSMPNAQALSYILTGRGLENSGENGSQNSIAAVAIGLGLSQSSKLIGNIGNTFGIHDLNVTTAGIGDNTKVVVSGSLTPKFKVKYGTGIFASLTELTLRYRLAPQLYLQWVSSINQTIDLMYKFEFD
ncbi:translocation/assembly module TamB domain-containing protein [Pasteurella atlantica]|uniref:Translocation/assembly module TamB domain-containing protein n=2 Tax=Pasteurellaceae TaxID=712 RepID=A0ACC6HNE4_9PAST|nr:translocation/assembly module TamB domain-containing protein [Pasteurella atlantica]MDP8052348.1 translocation/assembly module TamB domain-containing protein [Pasteurella atlantica]MDP8105099.1 translocation/assembly module TamB domain-containing protein [Pasteurella atlantica]MDP8148584.1 translocation/assembly module TamB domain-containing protein [Pasteurella atlantica]